MFNSGDHDSYNLSQSLRHLFVKHILGRKPNCVREQIVELLLIRKPINETGEEGLLIYVLMSKSLLLHISLVWY